MKSSKMNCATRDLASRLADGGRFARSLRRAASAVLMGLAPLLAMPLVAQAGVPGVVGEVTNLTNNLVSYSAGAPLQPAYAAFDVRFTNTSSSAIGSAFLRIRATTLAQTSTNAPLIINGPTTCLPDSSYAPGSAVICQLAFDRAGTLGATVQFRLNVQTPRAPTGFSGTDSLTVEYLIQAGQGTPNSSDDKVFKTDASTLVVQTSREIHSFVEAGQDLFVYVDQGRTNVEPPRPVLVGLNQSVNKQSCSPQVKKCLISTVTIVKPSNPLSTEQFYDPTWTVDNPGWLKISLFREASTLNKRANIENATVRYSKDGVNFIDVYNCSTLLNGVPQSSIEVAGMTDPLNQVGPNTHCIKNRHGDSVTGWTLDLIASENGVMSW